MVIKDRRRGNGVQAVRKLWQSVVCLLVVCLGKMLRVLGVSPPPLLFQMLLSLLLSRQVLLVEQMMVRGPSVLQVCIVLQTDFAL